MANLPSLDVPVGIRCTAIPDGIVFDEDNRPTKARLSLVLTPDTTAKKFELRDWPNTVSELAKNRLLRVYLGNKTTSNPKPLRPVVFSEADPVRADHGDADKLWKSIFGRPANAFVSLQQALRETEPPTLKYTNDPISEGPVIRDRIIRLGEINWVQTRYLNEAVNTFHDDAHFIRLLALLTATNPGQDYMALPIIRDLMIAILGDDAATWIASIANEVNTVPFRQKMLASLQHAVRTQLVNLGIGNPPNDGFGLLQRLAPPQPTHREGGTLDHDRKEAIKDILSGVLGGTRITAGTPDPYGFVQDRGKGQDMMRALFQEGARQHLKGPNVRASAPNLLQYQAQVAKNMEAFHIHWQNIPIGKALDTDALTQLEVDAARRKFFGIRALPTLAKFLRLIVDIKLELSLDDLGRYDWIAAMFVNSPDDMAEYGTPNHKPDVTAFEFDRSHQTYFRPCSWRDPRFKDQVTDLDSAPQITDGVVNLREPRFSISILDLPSSLNSMRLSAEQDASAQRSGTLLDSVSTRTTERQSRGLQLLDHMAPDQIASDLARFRYTSLTTPPPRPGSPERPFFAEDLVVGYRPYIQRTKQSAAPRTLPWRSLVARKVKFADIAAHVRGHDYESVRMRDHGYVRLAHKTQGGPPAPAPGAATGAPVVATAVPTTDGQMFAWMGASLGLSTDLRRYIDPGENPDTVPGQNPNTDLSLNIVYSFSKESHDLLPALRIGDGYMVGLSPVYPNGGGPTYEAATNAFQSAPVTLGDGMAPFIFGPPRDISVPALLLSQAEAEQWAKAETIKPRRGNAEHVERIVLRSATSPRNDKDNVTRYLVPPRASFETAEQWGMFDRVNEEVPPGAFTDYDLDPIHGAFVVWPPPTHQTNQKSKPPSEQQARCAVLRPLASSQQPIARYYPDPLARNLRAAFERNGATPSGFPDDIPLRQFWKLNASPITAKPIELLIKRWMDAREGGEIDFGDIAGKVFGSGASRTIDRLSIQLARAEEINLRIWCLPDRYDLLRGHKTLRNHIHIVVRELAAQHPESKLLDRDTLEHCIASLAQGTSLKDMEKQPPLVGLSSAQKAFLRVVDDTFNSVLAALMLQTPDNGLNAWLTLELVHAVEKPLAIPAIQCRPWNPEKLLIEPVRIQRNAAWDAYLKVNNVSASDPVEKVLSMPSEENGSTTYFVGILDFDRPSTGELRIEASWPETDPASAIREITLPAGAAGVKRQKKYEFSPPVKDRVMFSIKPPRDKGINPDGKLDLAFDETGIPRGLSYPFDDTAAREISLRLVGVSRFASDFQDEPSPSATPDALGRFEIESRPPMGSSRLTPATADAYRTYKVIVPASTPPAAPVVSRLEWVMPETLTEFNRGHRICVEKNFYPRLYLGQDWCRFDELLAVLCAPSDLVSERPYPPEVAVPPAPAPVPLSLPETLEAFAQRSIEASYFGKGRPGFQIAESVSRWGADPTSRSGPLTGTITRERFSGFVATKPEVALSATNPAQVAVLLYKPKFDPDFGEFYVDIGIDPGPAHGPIVQLVVARYQPHVIDPKFHLSTVTRVRPFQIAPKRKVEVLIQDDRHITTIVQGVGYTDRNIEIPASFGPSMPPNNAPNLPEYRYPLQNVRVIGLRENHSTTGIQVHNAQGLPLAVKHVAPQFYHPELIWISEFKLPLPSSQYHYGLQVEEVDLHFSDDAYEAGALAGAHVVERLSNFSLTVDLDRGLYVPTAES